MSTNVSAVTSHFPSPQNGFTTTTSATVLAGATVVPMNSVAGYTNGQVFVGVIEPLSGSAKQTFTGIVDTSGIQITGVKWTAGNDQTHVAGSTVVDYATATHVAMMSKGIQVHANQDGSLKPDAVQAALGTASVSGTGYQVSPYTFDTVVYNGNRSYTCTINGQNVTNFLSPGMRIRTQRTVAAPTQSTSLNGTNQYWSKTAPAGMTFTNNFAVSAWVKVTSYNTSNANTIVSRFNNISGWELISLDNGTVRLTGYNAGAGNYLRMVTYQSVPLNKWVHITAQLDMTVTTNSDATNYIMIDGVSVPVLITRAGTNPTALIQAGNLLVGSRDTGADALFSGKIAQVAVFSSKLTQDVARSYYSQGLTGTETSLISAYSFNGNANDLNTTNANNLTSNNGATATAADSPFGGQADGTISSTLDYGIVQKATFSTNTTLIVQVAEGCTIPTSGGVAAVAYSSQKVPYNFPADVGKWTLETLATSSRSQAGAASTWYEFFKLSIPTGSWLRGYNMSAQHVGGTSVLRAIYATVSTTSGGDSEDLARLTRICAIISTEIYANLAAEAPYTVSVATDNYLNARVGSTAANANGLTMPAPSTQAGAVIYARNALL